MHSAYRFIYFVKYLLSFPICLQIENIEFSYEQEEECQFNLLCFWILPFFLKRLDLVTAGSDISEYQKSIILLSSNFRSFWSWHISAAADILLSVPSLQSFWQVDRENSTSTLRSHIIIISWQLWMTSSFSHAWFYHRYTGLPFV